MKLHIVALLFVAVLLTAPFALADNTTNNATNSTDNSTTINETVVAEENTTVTSEDEQDEAADEASFMIRPEGAEVRLLQLAKSIERNIARGEAVITAGNFTEEQVAQLEDQLAVLTDLLNEVNAMDVEGTPQELAADFVAIKKEAIQASQTFRDIARDIVGESRARAIREQVHQRVQQRVMHMKEEIQQKRNMHNAMQMQRLYDTAGIANDTLVAQVRAGEVAWKDVKEQVRSQMKTLSLDDKATIAQRAKENALKREVFRASVHDASLRAEMGRGAPEQMRGELR